jgi:hypothetical protein
MPPPELQDGAHSSYKTNLGLLVDAMETSDKPRNQHQHHPVPTAHARNSARGDQTQMHQAPLPGDARMHSLLAASFAVSHPPNYPGSATPPTPHGEAPTNTGSDKVSTIYRHQMFKPWLYRTLISIIPRRPKTRTESESARRTALRRRFQTMQIVDALPIFHVRVLAIFRPPP